MKFVTTNTTDLLDLRALHRLRERFVSQRTGITNQIRAFMLERGIAVGPGFAIPPSGIACHSCLTQRCAVAADGLSETKWAASMTAPNAMRPSTAHFTWLRRLVEPSANAANEI